MLQKIVWCLHTLSSVVCWSFCYYLSYFFATAFVSCLKIAYWLECNNSFFPRLYRKTDLIKYIHVCSSQQVECCNGLGSQMLEKKKQKRIKTCVLANRDTSGLTSEMSSTNHTLEEIRKINAVLKSLLDLWVSVCSDHSYSETNEFTTGAEKAMTIISEPKSQFQRRLAECDLSSTSVL